jgi:DNA primase
VRGARPQADYLIERARQMFPGPGADQKVKAMNFLLPHIRRMPEKLARDQFAADAAQKLGIDSAVLREELRQAALKRRDRIEVRATVLTEVEKVLLRALAIVDPDYQRARRLAADAILKQPAWFQDLRSVEAMKALAGRQAGDPMTAVDDPAQQALLAEALLGETRPPDETEVASSLQQLQERAIENRVRQLRGSIAEAERRGDFAEIAILMNQKMELDNALRQLHRDNHP